MVHIRIMCIWTFVLYGDVGVIQACIVGANGCMSVLGGGWNGVFQIFYLLQIIWMLLLLCEYTLLVLMALCHPVFNGLCFLMFCGRLQVIFWFVCVLLHIGILLMVLFPDFVASTNVVLYLIVLLEIDSFLLAN
jgi:hypothetical protein